MKTEKRKKRQRKKNGDTVCKKERITRDHIDASQIRYTMMMQRIKRI